MKRSLMHFRDKELIFIVVGLIIGFVLANPCIKRSNIEYGVCDRFYSATFTEWIIRSFGVWFILKIGQKLGGVVHSCEEVLQRRKDKESKLLEDKQRLKILENKVRSRKTAEALARGIRESKD